jgi:hypothetical protein
VGGSVRDAFIAAGYDRSGAAVNADASIGTVAATRWAASSLVAGVTSGPDGFFGTEDDTLISHDDPIVAKIASVLITGYATGNGQPSANHFGFVAEEIGTFRVRLSKLALKPGPSNDLAGLQLYPTDNLTIREVA